VVEGPGFVMDLSFRPYPGCAVKMGHEPHEPHEQRLLRAEEVFAIQGAVFEVNRHMGAGFLEAGELRRAPKARIEPPAV
jgi:hypothetical protein